MCSISTLQQQEIAVISGGFCGDNGMNPHDKAIFDLDQMLFMNDDQKHQTRFILQQFLGKYNRKYANSLFLIVGLVVAGVGINSYYSISKKLTDQGQETTKKQEL